jgi:hypothetical protein
MNIPAQLIERCGVLLLTIYLKQSRVLTDRKYCYQVGLLNVDGFYDPLLSFIDLSVKEGFINEDARRIIISAPTAKELVLKLEVHTRSHTLILAPHYRSRSSHQEILVYYRSTLRSTRWFWCGRTRCRRRRPAESHRSTWSPGSRRPEMICLGWGLTQQADSGRQPAPVVE